MVVVCDGPFPSESDYGTTTRGRITPSFTFPFTLSPSKGAEFGPFDKLMVPSLSRDFDTLSPNGFLVQLSPTQYARQSA